MGGDATNHDPACTLQPVDCESAETNLDRSTAQPQPNIVVAKKAKLSPADRGKAISAVLLELFYTFLFSPS